MFYWNSTLFRNYKVNSSNNFRSPKWPKKFAVTFCRHLSNNYTVFSLVLFSLPQLNVSLFVQKSSNFYFSDKMTFADIGLSKWLIKTLTECAITSPTDVQNATIEPTLEGRGFYSEFLNVFSSCWIQNAGNVLL